MKTIALFLAAAFMAEFASSAQTSTGTTRGPTIKLVGISNADGVSRALLDITPSGPHTIVNHELISEGQRDRGVEVVRIDWTNGVVEILETRDGSRRKMTLEGADKPLTTATGLRLRDADLSYVLKLYAAWKNRTLLTHPKVKVKPLTFEASGSAGEIVAALDTLFEQHGIVRLPDGDKFLMLVPAALTNDVAIRSQERAAKAANDREPSPEPVMSAGLVDFRGADMASVLQLYAQMVNRKLALSRGLPDFKVHFKNQTPLSRAEVVYGLETLFSWNGIALIPGEDGTLRAERAERQ